MLLHLGRFTTARSLRESASGCVMLCWRCLLILLFSVRLTLEGCVYETSVKIMLTQLWVECDMFVEGDEKELYKTVLKLVSYFTIFCMKTAVRKGKGRETKPSSRFFRRSPNLSRLVRGLHTTSRFFFLVLCLQSRLHCEPALPVKISSIARFIRLIICS